MTRFIQHSLILALILVAVYQYAQIGSEEGEVYPRKPIRVVVPFNPGGGTDTFARFVQKVVRDENLMPQPLVIVNKPGGGATIGSSYVRDARNDGYTILCLHEGLLTSKVAGQSPNGPDDYEPVAATGEIGQVVLVSKDSPYQTMNALMEAAKANPETVRFGVNLNTPTHFSGIMLENTSLGTRFRFVSTGGGANRLAALMGGHLDAAIFSVGELIRFRENGLRAICYFGEERLDVIPDVPTGKELGYPVYSSNLQYWWFPKGTSQEIVDYFADVLGRAMDTDYVRERCEELQIIPRIIAKDELRDRIDRKMKAYGETVLPQRVALPNMTLWALSAIAVFGMTVLAKTLFEKKAEAIVVQDKEEPLRYDLAFGTVVIAIAYVLLMGLGMLSFVWATILFVVVTGLYLTRCDKSKLVYVAELALAMSFGLHYVFTQVFAIDLP